MRVRVAADHRGEPQDRLADPAALTREAAEISEIQHVMETDHDEVEQRFTA